MTQKRKFSLVSARNGISCAFSFPLFSSSQFSPDCRAAGSSKGGKYLSSPRVFRRLKEPSPFPIFRPPCCPCLIRTCQCVSCFSFSSCRLNRTRHADLLHISLGRSPRSATNAYFPSTRTIPREQNPFERLLLVLSFFSITLTPPLSLSISLSHAFSPLFSRHKDTFPSSTRLHPFRSLTFFHSETSLAMLVKTALAISLAALATAAPLSQQEVSSVPLVGPPSESVTDFCARTTFFQGRRQIDLSKRSDIVNVDVGTTIGKNSGANVGAVVAGNGDITAGAFLSRSSISWTLLKVCTLRENPDVDAKLGHLLGLDANVRASSDPRF